MACTFHMHATSVDSLDINRSRLGCHLKAQSYDSLSLPNDNFTNSNLSVSDVSTPDSLELTRVRLGYPEIPEFEFQARKRRNREAYIRRRSEAHTNLGDRLNTFEGWTEIVYAMEEERSGTEARESRGQTETREAEISSFPLVLMGHTECTACTDIVPKSLSVETTCNHVYCFTCVEHLISQSLAGAESSFPPRCCPESTPIALDLIRDRIDAQLISRIQDKTEEYAIPRAKRVYCPNGGCSVFLGSHKSFKQKIRLSSSTPPTAESSPPVTSNSWRQGRMSIRKLGLGIRATPCPSCSTQICLRCYQTLDIHPFLTDRGPQSSSKWQWKPISVNPCSLPLPRTSPEKRLRRQNSGTAQLRLLATKEKWKKCPGCARIVERNEGCDHMTCLCGTNFCYRCGGLWNKRSWCHYYVVGRPWPGAGIVQRLLG